MPAEPGAHHVDPVAMAVQRLDSIGKGDRAVAGNGGALLGPVQARVPMGRRIGGEGRSGQQADERE